MQVEEDAKLIRLGEELARYRARERQWYTNDAAVMRATDDEIEAMGEHLCCIATPIHAAIIATPATTLDGLFIKARALASCCSMLGNGDDTLRHINAFVEEAGTTDMKVALSIARDLLRMAGEIPSASEEVNHG